MENNLKAVEYIYSQFPSLEHKQEGELTGNQKILKMVAVFFENNRSNEVEVASISKLRNLIHSLSEEELKVAIRASLIFEGEMIYPMEIKNHSVIDGNKPNYQPNNIN